MNVRAIIKAEVLSTLSGGSADSIMRGRYGVRPMARGR